MESGFGSDFGSDFASGGGGGGKLDPGLIMEQVKVQIAVANAQELLQRMTDKCFRKCIGKPGGALDNSEQVSAAGETRGPAGHPAGRPLRALLSRRSASPCAWTGTWTPGTRFPEPTTLGCSGREPTCDAPRLLERGGTTWGRDERPVQVVGVKSCCLSSPCRGRAINPR
uniref:Translocase of inner mitochondrial membrane 13 n=1 Tax=Aquila chrysaetos chrysaetos TaxID=223781 RepID=A0A663F714_AQUCH